MSNSLFLCLNLDLIDSFTIRHRAIDYYFKKVDNR